MHWLYPVYKCPSASIVVTSTSRVNEMQWNKGKEIILMSGFSIIFCCSITFPHPIIVVPPGNISAE